MLNADGGPIGALARRIRDGQPTLAGWSTLGEPAAAEVLVRAGFHAAVLDLQHGAYTVESAIRGISAVALAGAPALARLPVCAASIAARLFDAGAAGVIAPMIDSTEDARAVVEATKYPPIGRRSWGAYRAIPLSGLAARDYFAAANTLHLTIPMIETRAALEQVEAILAVPGVDGVLLGPSDLSIALTGGPPDPSHPEVERAIDRVAGAARAAGKLPAIFCASGRVARAMFARGFTFCAIATDAALLAQAARAELADAS